MFWVDGQIIKQNSSCLLDVRYVVFQAVIDTIQCFTYTEVLEANYNYEKNLKMFYSAEMAVLYRGTIVLIYPLINYFLS